MFIQPHKEGSPVQQFLKIKNDVVFQNITYRCFKTNSKHARTQRGGGDRGSGPPSPWKLTIYIGFLAILVRIPWKSQSCQANIQCWATIGTPAKRHSNAISLVGQWWPFYSGSGIWIVSPPINLNKINKTLSKLDPLWQNFLGPRMKSPVPIHLQKITWLSIFSDKMTSVDMKLVRKYVY